MAGQSILVQISIIYCMIHTYVLLLVFYDYRCSKRVFLLSSVAVFCITGGICLWVLFTQGIAAMGQWGVLVGALPTLAFFFFMSRQRSAQFVFIFCLTDTVCMWLELASTLIDFAVGGGGVVTFVLRLVSFPVLEYVVWRWLRRPFLEISRLVQKGWLLFAVLTGICYLILVQLSVFPTAIFERPQDIPLAVMVLVLIALAYATIFQVLFEQLHVLEAQERQRVLEAQALMMSRRMEDIRRAQETMRIERHDMRHQLQTAVSLARQGETATLLDYVGKAQEKLDSTIPKIYCTNLVLDAVLSNASAQAERMGIDMETEISVPEELPVDILELSIVFANALENAIQAVKDLPPGQRRIICKSVMHPRLMMEISNPYAGKISFDRRGFPIAERQGHGIGTRSIIAFAEKYSAVCLFRAENGWFKVQLAV